MRRLPPLIAIEAFVEIARLGSLKAAAESLALSSSALSRRLATLERIVGQSLFERRHQSLVVTSEGERLLARVTPALDALAHALDRPTGGTELLRLRLGVQPLFASQRLMPRLAELRALQPGLHIDIDTAPHALARLNDGLDAAIALAIEPDPSLHARRIDSNHVLAIGSKAEAVRLRDPAQLGAETLLLHRELPEAFDIWREALGHHDLEPAAIDYLDSGQLMLDAAAQGLGIAFMLDSHLQAAADDRLAPLFEAAVPSPYNYWFVARRSAMTRRPVRLFYNWLFDTLGEVEERKAA